MEIHDSAELDRILGDGRTQYLELWRTSPEDRAMCALINGNRGWLMYLRENGDAGFRSVNETYSGNEDDVIDYFLDNGQQDEYPAFWALPITEIDAALRYFIEKGTPPHWIAWHNDSDDGCVISEQNPTGDLPEGVTVDDSEAHQPFKHDELTTYIYDNYKSLLTDQELDALYQARTYLRGGPYGEEGVSLTSLSDNDQIRSLGALNPEERASRIVQRILAEHKSEVILNSCPKCNRLCRTPRAKQCRYCNHDWH